MQLPGQSRISIDPAVCGGRPVITGTRVRVSDIIGAFAKGDTEDELLADFPYLAAEDIRAALAYAAKAVAHPVVIAAERGFWSMPSFRLDSVAG